MRLPRLFGVEIVVYYAVPQGVTIVKKDRSGLRSSPKMDLSRIRILQIEKSRLLVAALARGPGCHKDGEEGVPSGSNGDDGACYCK